MNRVIMMDEKTIDLLINSAKNIANKNFCCKHSNFTVGCALLTSDNKLYTGFNIENDGIMSICAERVTLCKALSEFNNSFKAMAIEGKFLNDSKFIKTLPCGYCRQFLSEYVGKDFIIYTYSDEDNKLYTYKLSDLLPESFSL